MSRRKDHLETASEKEFAHKAGALFQQSVDELDAATSSRLNQARQAAISEVAVEKVRFGRWLPWVPATGVAAAAAVAVVMWSTSQQIEPEAAIAPLTDISDFELLLDEDGLEMLEDLEFYAWLGSEQESEPDVG